MVGFVQKLMGWIALGGAVCAAGVHFTSWTSTAITDFLTGQPLDALKHLGWDVGLIGSLCHAHFNWNFFGVNISTENLPIDGPGGPLDTGLAAPPAVSPGPAAAAAPPAVSPGPAAAAAPPAVSPGPAAVAAPSNQFSKQQK